MSKCCFYCGREFGLLEEHWNVMAQDHKNHPRYKVGPACDDCVELRNKPIFYRLWKGEIPPGAKK